MKHFCSLTERCKNNLQWRNMNKKPTFPTNDDDEKIMLAFNSESITKFFPMSTMLKD